MKNILIPTDFSDNAGDALKYALNLINKTRVNLHITHVVQLGNIPLEGHLDASHIVSMEMKEANKSLEAIKAFGNLFFNKEKNGQINISTSVSAGLVATNIKMKAEEIGADLIIMGTQGVNKNLAEKMLGTISTQTISLAPCPVILVPSGYDFKAINNAVFATKLNHSDPYELWRATELIKPHVKTVRCIHIISKEEKVDKSKMEQFVKYMLEHSPVTQTIFNIEESDNIEKTLYEYTENYNAEMIIMHRSKRSFWKDLFGFRHTNKMASRMKTPLMILENKS